MKLEKVLEMNKMIKDEIDAEIMKLCSSTGQNNVDEELILQEKLISLLLILRKENQYSAPPQVGK